MTYDNWKTTNPVDNEPVPQCADCGSYQDLALSKNNDWTCQGCETIRLRQPNRRSKDEWVAQAAKMEAERDNLQREVELLTALLGIAMPAGEKALRADIDFHLNTIDRLATENGHLRALLSDALLILELKFGKEATSNALIGQIRRALGAKSGHG